MPDIELLGATYPGVSGVNLPTSGGGYAYFIYFGGLFYNNAGAHNAIYRGKCLGTSVTAEQWASISAGTFDDMYIGDYWEINNIIWRIAGFDYWLETGNTKCDTHHVVIVPAGALVTGIKMNGTKITTGAYVGCDFYSGSNGNTGRSQCQSIINSAFGAAHILSHKECLKNATRNGYELSRAWYDSTFELMTEQMLYGCKAFGNCVNSTAVPGSQTIDGTQLPLFSMMPSAITVRSDYWLRDVASSTQFAAVSSYGYSNLADADAALAIRPVFGICA